MSGMEQTRALRSGLALCIVIIIIIIVTATIVAKKYVSIWLLRGIQTVI